VVVSPRDGTALPDDEVLDVVKRWTSARVWRPSRLRPRTVLACAAAVLGFVLIGWAVGGHFEGVRGLTFGNRQPGPGVTTPAAESARRLHVLAVGISRYQEGSLKLNYGRDDAVEVARVLRAQEPALFKQVSATVLTDDEATRAAIVEAMGRLAKEAAPDDLAVVTLSGHGDNLAGADQFYFLPYDFDSRPGKQLSSSVSWAQLAELLAGIRCSVFVVVDTCHAGTATRKLPTGEAASPGGSRRAIVVMAACLSRGKAQESSQWGHGVLTLALLEALEGRHRYKGKAHTPVPAPGERGAVSVHDLISYVPRRVEELMGSRQEVVFNNSGDVGLVGIPLAVPASSRE
jgi:hypothetical protein